MSSCQGDRLLGTFTTWGEERGVVDLESARKAQIGTQQLTRVGTWVDVRVEDLGLSKY